MTVPTPPPETKRRHLQFGLSAMVCLTLAVAVSCAALSAAGPVGRIVYVYGACWFVPFAVRGYVRDGFFEAVAYGLGGLFFCFASIVFLVFLAMLAAVATHP